MHGRKNILVAEDSENDVFLLRRAFTKIGAQCALRFVGDGQDAMDYLAGNNSFSDRTSHPLPDVLLLDLKMPKVNGFEVLLWVRGHTSFEFLPVVILSSSNEPEDILKAYQLKANSYLCKTGLHGGNDFVQGLCEYWSKLNICTQRQ